MLKSKTAVRLSFLRKLAARTRAGQFYVQATSRTYNKMQTPLRGSLKFDFFGSSQKSVVMQPPMDTDKGTAR